MAEFEYAITVVNLHKSFGNKVIIRDMSLSFFHGAKIGILGSNGSGKSTFLRILAGLDNDYKGQVRISDRLRVGYLRQSVDSIDNRFVKEILLEQGLNEVWTAFKNFNRISEQLVDPSLTENEMNKLLTEQAKWQEVLDSRDGWDLDRKVDEIARSVGISNLNAKFSELSGGEKRRVDLATLILSEPDILLLDEPTNHLDAEAVLWLEKFLKKYRGTVLAVTHDRYFLEEAAEWILELDRGNYYPYKGNYSDWLRQKQIRLEQEQRESDARYKTLKREAEWASSTPKARLSKNKARLNAYEQLLNLEKTERIRELEIFIPNGPRLGTEVVKIENICKSKGEKLLFKNFSMTVKPAAVIGIIGPNGVGKTTLFKLITGEDSIDSGYVRIGETVVIGYADQLRSSLNPSLPVWQSITENDSEQIKIGERWINVRSYLARFNFSGEDQQKPVQVLSGGEKNRLLLAKVLTKPCNVLLLDEPTNDLDIDSARALEEAILNFAGVVLVISHDRWFLDRISTHTLAPLGGGEWICAECPPSEFFSTREGQSLLKSRFGEAFLS
ncbi:MAG: energy-dependent translational throttle protein EttA [Deltaproteobacteria bacterium]|nr:energy-dependent translational throttle protein EttA [Deltaproteobacteria bacterium]